MTALRYPDQEPSQDWQCGRCRRSGTAPANAVLVWHRCTPPKRRRVVPMPQVRHVTKEELQTAAWSGLKEALDSRDPEWNLRR